MALTIAARTTGNSNNFSVSSQAVTLPNSGEVTGDLYLVFFAPGTNATCTTSSSGWTKLTQVGNGTDCNVAIFAGVAGSISALTVNLSASQQAAYCALRVNGWSGNINDIQISSTSTGNSTSHTNPSLTSSIGNIEHGWIVVDVDASGNTSQRVPTAAPAGYSNYNRATSNSSGATAEACVITAEKVLTAQTESPGAWSTATFAEAWATLLVAVPSFTQVNKSGSDSTAGTDTAATSVTFSPPRSDSAAGSDTAKVVQNQADSATMSESAKVMIVVGDSPAANDNGGQNISGSDSVSASDVAAVGVPITASDSATAAESALAIQARVALESATVSDTATISNLTSASDSFTVTESVNVRVSVTDSAAGGELIAPLRINGRLQGQRVYVILPEARRYVILPEARRYVIPPERRIYYPD